MNIQGGAVNSLKRKMSDEGKVKQAPQHNRYASHNNPTIVPFVDTALDSIVPDKISREDANLANKSGEGRPKTSTGFRPDGDRSRRQTEV